MWEVSSRSREALRKLTGHGFSQILPESVHGNDALEASETPPAEVDEDIEKVKVVQDLRQWKSQSYRGS